MLLKVLEVVEVEEEKRLRGDECALVRGLSFGCFVPLHFAHHLLSPQPSQAKNRQQVSGQNLRETPTEGTRGGNNYVQQLVVYQLQEKKERKEKKKKRRKKKTYFVVVEGGS